ncbi:hypothetical protein TcWFU_006732 [Taenia crassiceps]|uniref:Uncharacterized protein n=1 Tax=Taenia crassiceps TaxID=6207 RepID=A0ABR4QHS1_9CEST
MVAVDVPRIGASVKHVGRNALCQYHRPSYRRSSSADALPVHSSSLSLLFFSFSSSFTFLLSIVMTKRVGEKSNFTTFIFRPFTYRLPSLPLSLPPSSSSLSSALFSPFSSLPAFYCPVTLLPPPSFNISSSSYAHSSISPFHPPSLHFTPFIGLVSHAPTGACRHQPMSHQPNPHPHLLIGSTMARDRERERERRGGDVAKVSTAFCECHLKSSTTTLLGPNVQST